MRAFVSGRDWGGGARQPPARLSFVFLMTLQWLIPLISMAAACEPPSPMISTERARLPRHTCGFGLEHSGTVKDHRCGGGRTPEDHLCGRRRRSNPRRPPLWSEEVGPQACILFLL
ncbi:unnamed protein product [Gadus morhua 'NCC']